MALLQGTKKLFGPLLDDLDLVSDVKEAMELQVEETYMRRRCFKGPRNCWALCQMTWTALMS
jgi:hypothetical protein